jgi:hypothetical protein
MSWVYLTDRHNQDQSALINELDHHSNFPAQRTHATQTRGPRFFFLFPARPRSVVFCLCLCRIRKLKVRTRSTGTSTSASGEFRQTERKDKSGKRLLLGR